MSRGSHQSNTVTLNVVHGAEGGRYFQRAVVTATGINEPHLNTSAKYLGPGKQWWRGWRGFSDTTVTTDQANQLENAHLNP